MATVTKTQTNNGLALTSTEAVATTETIVINTASSVDYDLLSYHFYNPHSTTKTMKIYASNEDTATNWIDVTASSTITVTATSGKAGTISPFPYRWMKVTGISATSAATGTLSVKTGIMLKARAKLNS